MGMRTLTEKAGNCQENIVSNWPGDTVAQEPGSSIDYKCGNLEAVEDCCCSPICGVFEYQCRFPELMGFFVQYSKDNGSMLFESLNRAFFGKPTEKLINFAKDYMQRVKERAK